MHYIKLLRPPLPDPRGSRRSLKIVLAITTDLSDAYLSPQTPVDLAVLGISSSPSSPSPSLSSTPSPPQVLNFTPARTPRWQSGLRALKFDVSLPSEEGIWTLQIRPAESRLAALSTTDIYGAQDGLILPVYFDLPAWGGETQPRIDRGDHVCFRSLRLAAGAVALPPAAIKPLQIEEELGESMARHIWDAGLVTVSLAAHLCLGSTTGDDDGDDDDPTSVSSPSSPPRAAMPTLRRMLSGAAQRTRPLNVIELGCGVGISGIGVAQILGAGAASCPRLTADGAEIALPPHVLMTDLPDAEERTRQNMARYVGGRHDHQKEGSGSGNSDPGLDRASTRIDYENLDWEDGRDGRFGLRVKACAWDLVLVTDCTYNDLMPSLVRTVSALHAHSATCGHHQEGDRGKDGKDGNGNGDGTKVLLTTKRRHEAEARLFGLMAADGWAIEEEMTVPLPVLGGPAQAIEVYLFTRE